MKQAEKNTLEKDKRLIRDYIIPGLDVIKGFERYNENLMVYASIMSTYATDARISLETIKRVDVQGLNYYKITIHWIKNASFDIYANQIGEVAKDLERAAVNDDIDYIIHNNPAFLKAAFRLLDRLDIMLAYIKTVKRKSIMNRSDGMFLKKLLTAYNNYDVVAADAVIEETKQHQVTTNA